MVVALVLTLLLVLVISYAGGFFSGNTIFYEVKECTDDDVNDKFPDGINSEVRGTTKLGKAVFRDNCNAGSGNLVEYYCTSDGLIDSVERTCGFGCTTGRCRDFPFQ